MKEKDFKRTVRPPACTKAPWYNLISKASRDVIMRRIREETIEAYGYSMDECPKRKTCFTKSCIGRPLPLLSETAKPYIEQLKQTHNIQNGELFLSNCDTCTIAKSCKHPCYQINDFLDRASNKEPDVVVQENLESPIDAQLQEAVPKTAIFNNSDIPWDCLTSIRVSVIKKYLYEGKDFLKISKELDLNNQARVKYEFYAALTKLSEFAVVRKFLNEHGESLKESNNDIYDLFKMVYLDNKSITDIAEINKETKQAVQQRLTRAINKLNITWYTFVKKQNGKIIYNVPRLFK